MKKYISATVMILSTLSFLSLSACSTENTENIALDKESENMKQNKTSYKCEKGSELSVSFDAPFIRLLTEKGYNMTLQPVASASGAQYALNGYEFHPKDDGSAIWITPGNEKEMCQEIHPKEFTL